MKTFNQKTIKPAVLRMVLGTAALGLTAIVPAGATSAVSSEFFGMVVSSVPTNWPQVPVGSLGQSVGHIWANIQPSSTTYSWSDLDKYVSAASSNNVDGIFVFYGTPEWAVGSDTSSCTGSVKNFCTLPPANIQDWINFVTAVAQRNVTVYNDQIKFFEIWEEANSSTFWTGTNAEMVALSTNAVTLIHSIDPSATVLTPAVSGLGSGAHDPLTWMSSYLAAMQAANATFPDAGAWHGYLANSVTPPNPYPWPEDSATTDQAGCGGNTAECSGPIDAKASAFQALFNQYPALAGKPMYDTSGSWGLGAPGSGTTEDAAAWIARWYILQASTGVASAYWWLYGPPPDWGAIENADGSPGTAAIAYAQVYDWLLGATFSVPCSADSKNTWTCQLTRPGNYQGLIVWNTYSDGISYTPAENYGTYTQYRTLAGNTVPYTFGPVTIGLEPIILEHTNKSPTH